MSRPSFIAPFTFGDDVAGMRHLIVEVDHLDLHGASLVSQHYEGHLCDFEFKRRRVWGPRDAPNLKSLDGHQRDAWVAHCEDEDRPVRVLMADGVVYEIDPPGPLDYWGPGIAFEL